MNLISRGIRNAFRNYIRSISIIFILALAIAMSLIMLLSLKTVQSKIDSVKGSIGNIITVAPAGIRGFEGGGELLNESQIASISTLPHVSKVTKTVSDRLQTDENTNLVSAVEAGSFGNRQKAMTNSNQTNGSGNSNNPPPDFKMPIMITGTNDLDSLASLNVSNFTTTSGVKFDANSTDNIAMVGKSLAEKNNLSVDSLFKAYDKDIKVVGIFDSGNNFANNMVVMPIKTLQTLSGQTDQINNAIVQIDSIDNISQVQSAIKEKLGDKADVTSQQDTSNQALAPLENIKTIASYSLIGSLVAGAVIILLLMMMIVRERRREIGVLKAIGASNMVVMFQFIIESLVLTFTGSIFGMILGFIFSNPVLNVLVNNSAAQENNTRKVGEMGGAIMMRFGEGIGGAQNALKSIHAIVGYDIILYGLLAAVIIAIIGSAIPAFIISKVRPAEAMRAE